MIDTDMAEREINRIIDAHTEQLKYALTSREVLIRQDVIECLQNLKYYIRRDQESLFLNIREIANISKKGEKI